MSNKDSKAWRELAEQKEKEWRNVLESRIEDLEASCKEKDKELISEKSRLKELKEHFKYNLKLLEERDRELEKYESNFAEIRANLNSKNAEISELKIHLDDLNNVIKREEKMRDELQATYQRRLREKQNEIDSYRSFKDGELHDERKEYEEFRRNLQRQLTSVQNELETQKRELTTEFESSLKKREHEFKIQTDELSSKCFQHELKVKLLEKELDLARESNDKVNTTAEQVETSHRELEKKLKQKEWELTDVTSMKDSQKLQAKLEGEYHQCHTLPNTGNHISETALSEIAEFESRVAASESSMKKMQEDFQRKYIEMDKSLREKEEKLERYKNGYLEREQALQDEVRELQSKLEDAQIKERQATWTHQDAMKEKDMQIEKLQEEVSDIKTKWDRHIAEISREHVSRDLELSSALEEQRRLQLELDQRKEDLNRYKKELELGTEREAKLDREKAQVELDWQRRCEDLERQQYDKSEDLIKRLTTARNEAQALVKERERELRHKVLLIKSLHRERDQLRSLLKRHDIPLNDFARFSVETEEEEMNFMEDLQKQNAHLRDLIGQMTRQMEALGNPPATQQMPAPLSSLDDVQQSLREEMSELKKENKELKERLYKHKSKEVRPSPQLLQSNEDILSQVEENTPVKKHILALNEAMGNLRSEKVEIAATVKKQQARIAYLERSLEETSKQPRLKQIQNDQLTYELTSQQRRHEGEVTGLKNRVSELELQLSEARREADEYHRASLERNQELVALGNQLSALKMEMAEANPSVNFGAQELYIQQLQSELNQLRKRSAALETPDVNSIDTRLTNVADGMNSSDSRGKLKSAAAKIVQLAKENQQLIESNNKLRAQLKAAAQQMSKAEVPSQEKRQTISTSDFEKQESKSDDYFGRLSQLEKLQYQLTKQELQFAHRFKTTPDKTLETYKSSEEDVNEYVPQKDVEAVTRKDIDPQMLMSMSSGGGESIQKVWQMLDSIASSEASSPRSVPPSKHEPKPSEMKPREIVRPDDGGDSFQVSGQRVTPERKSARNPKARTIVYPRKQTSPVAKVRNYNIKEDSSVR